MKALLLIVFLMLSHAAYADNLRESMAISAAGMRAQSDRLRIVSQNIANADSTGLAPGEEPYRRKTIFFKNVRDPKTGQERVVVKGYGVDQTPFELEYNPSHPAADERGYIKRPNVNPLIEMQDAKEAQRGYEANLNMIDLSRGMVSKTIDILR